MIFMADVMVFTHLVILPARATLAMITLPIPLNAQVIHARSFTNMCGQRRSESLVSVLAQKLLIIAVSAASSA